jgi:hypothetical protein
VLNAKATEAGIDASQVATWGEVATMLLEGTDGSEGGDASAAEAPEPQKGELYFYKPPRARNAVECEVTAVFNGKQVVNLRNLNDGTLYRSVPYDQLRDSV